MCFDFIVGIFIWSSKHFIDGMCVVALVPATNTMSGVIFHPFVMRIFISGWYFVVFMLMDSLDNMSLNM